MSLPRASGLGAELACMYQVCTLYAAHELSWRPYFKHVRHYHRGSGGCQREAQERARVPARPAHALLLGVCLWGTRTARSDMPNERVADEGQQFTSS